MPIVKCANCGSDVDRATKTYNQQIRRGQKNFFCNQSCASSFNTTAQHVRWRETHQLKPKYKYSERKKLSPESFSLSSISGRIAGRAKEAGIPCTLNTKNLRELWIKQKGLCFFSGVLMQLGKSKRGLIDPDQLSVDRIVPEKGYTPENVVLCCYWINSAKMRMTVDEFKVRVGQLSKYLLT